MKHLSLLDAIRYNYQDVFDSDTLRKGSRVLSSSLVERVFFDGESLLAEVGSESEDYQRYGVRIGYIGDFLDYSCECPVGTDCKHCAAVVLGVLTSPSIVKLNRTATKTDQSADRFMLMQSLLKSAPKKSPLLDTSDERRTNVEPKTDYYRSFQPWAVAPAAPRPDAESAKQYRIAYAIHLDSRYGASRSRVQPQVSRVLVYVRKDGSAGGLKKWTAAFAPAPVPEDALGLEAVFEAEEVSSLPLPVVGPYLLQLKETGLYLSSSQDPLRAKPVQVWRAKNIRVEFDPSALSADGSSIDYRIRAMIAEGEPRKSRAYGPPLDWACVAAGGMFYAAADRFYWANGGYLGSPLTARTLGLLEAGDALVDHRGVPSLLARLEEVGDESMEIVAPPTRIERVLARPEVEVVLSPLREGRPPKERLVCELFFNYDGRDVGGDTPPLTFRRRGDVVEVRERNHDFERDALMYFAHACGDRLLELRRFPRPAPVVDADFALFARELFTPLNEAGYRFAVETAGRRRSVAPAKLGVRLDQGSGIDWFSADLKLRVPDDELAVDESVSFVGGNLVAVGSRLVFLDAKDLAALAELGGAWDRKLKRFRVDTRDLSRIAALGAVAADDAATLGRESSAASVAAALQKLLEERRRLFESLTGLAPLGEVPVPSGFAARLRPYQKRGYDWMLRLLDAGLGALLADDMGLGKTLQALAVLVSLKERGALKPALVVAPVTVVGNWEAEAARFAPGLSVGRHHGPGRAADAESVARLLAERDLVLTSYQTLRLDLPRFAERRYSIVVLDEAQAIKNPVSGVAHAVRALSADRRLILTGTPVENRPLDLWSHFAFLLPGFLGGEKDFSARYEKPIRNGDAAALDSLRRRTLPFILRRRKEEVLDDLPPKEEIIRWVELEGKRGAFYESLRKRYADMVSRVAAGPGLQNSAVLVLEALLRLRQASIHPGLINAEHEKLGSAKLEELYDIIEELREEGHKALVFSQFVGVLAYVRAYLEEKAIPFEYLDGQTKDRAKHIRRFESDPAVPVFLLSLKAGGVGINLVAADYVILLDPWWNPAVESQAVDRAHRIGQKRKVTVYRLASRGTVEEKIIELQTRKRKLVDDLVAETGSGLAGFSTDEILALFD